MACPSIVVGIFAWEILVKPLHHFSALSGGIALGAMMIPLTARTTEEMIRTVPNSLREAALALGYTNWPDLAVHTSRGPRCPASSPAFRCVGARSR